MISLWYVEAGKYNVLPVDGRGQLRLADLRPQLSAGRKKYTYYPGTQTVPQGQSPYLLNRAYSITVELEIPKGGAEGVLISQGGVDGGYSLYVKGWKLCYAYNYVASEYFDVESKSPLPEGRHSVRLEFEPTGKPDLAAGKGAPGVLRLFVDGKSVGEGSFPYTIPISLGLAGAVSIGRDEGAPVTSKYEAPFAFSGKIKCVIIDVSGEALRDADAETRVIMAHQ